ncbi:transposase [Streptomyces sp. NPDC059679]|uniref:transposase n=1 Tax=Streptomyces sp. NPDC059679 TaxID=3346903 RepID=UPI0036A17C84
MAVVVTAGQRGDSPQFEAVLGRVRVPRLGPGRPRTRPRRVRADRAYASRANRAYLRRRGTGAPSRTRPTRRATARSGALAVVGRRSSTPLTTARGMRSSAASIASRDTGRWPRAMTSWRSATRRPSSSRSSTSGYDQRIQ